MDGRARRLLFHGSGDTWYHLDDAETVRPDLATSVCSGTELAFQYKGLYPAIEEAGRVSFGYRYKLQGMVDDVPCVGCMGARLRDDAAAVRFQGLTLDQITRKPLGRVLEFFKELKLDTDERHIAGDLMREIRDRLSFLVEVGLDYLTLARGTPTLFWRRKPAHPPCGPNW